MNQVQDDGCDLMSCLRLYCIIRKNSAALTAVAQELIGEHTGHHRFADRHSTDADAGIVAPLGGNFGLVAVFING